MKTYPYYETAGLASNPRCQLSVHLPPGVNGPAPAMLWFHGGGFTVVGAEAGPGFPEWVTSRGVALISASYRLYPEVNYPAYIEDGAQAVAWVQRHAGELGLDPDRIFIGGMSAGAYLAALLALNENLLRKAGGDARKLCGAFILSGQLTTHFHIREERGLPAGCIISDEASPMYHARKDTIPLCILVGDKDIPCRPEENQYFASVLKEIGHEKFSFRIVPDRTHDTICSRMTELGDPVGETLDGFIRKYGDRPS